MSPNLRRRGLLTAAVAAPVAVIAGPPATAAARTAAFPATLRLPNGFRPEGIDIGPGPYAYFGSLGDGRLHRVDLRTGAGRDVAPSPGPGRVSVGLKTDPFGRAWVAGGGPDGGNGLGDARLVSLRGGKLLRQWELGGGFVNDQVFHRGSVWFTDSFKPVLYRIGADGRGGAATLRLSGDYRHQEGWNANGIAQTPDRRALLIPQNATGELHRVDPKTGRTDRVETTGAPDSFGDGYGNGDGLLVLGRTLYVVQNALNAVDVFRLDASGRRSTWTRRITDPRFAIPTTAARFGGRLYLPNARFDTQPTPDTEYTAVAVRL